MFLNQIQNTSWITTSTHMLHMPSLKNLKKVNTTNAKHGWLFTILPFLSKGILFLDSIFPVKEIEDQEIEPGDIAVAAKFELWDFNTVKHTICTPTSFLEIPALSLTFPAIKEDMGLRLSFQSLDPQTEKIQIKIEEEQAEKKDFIVLQAIVFPYINLLWLGCVLMVIGYFYRSRSKTQTQEKLKAIQSLALFGGGNVAQHLSKALHSKGVSFTQVFSRNLEHAQNLAKELKAEATDKAENVRPTDASPFLAQRRCLQLCT